MTDAVTQLNVLVVDDEPAMLTFFTRILRNEGHIVHVATDGLEALKAVASHALDVVLLDVRLPGLSGIEVCQRLKQARATRLLPIILVTSLSDREHRIEGLRAGADDFLNKPVDVEELLVRLRSLGRMKRYTDDLDSATAIVMTLAELIEARDGRAEGHCHRMANYATALGRHLGLEEDAIQALHRGGFLHDVGMLAIPDSVLRKAGPLSPEEFEQVKSHTRVGDSLCQMLHTLQAVRPIVRHHHERLDGSGYPDGLCGDAIPLAAQITAIADTYEAATTRRPYQDVQSAPDALAILRRHVEIGWKRQDLVEEFCAMIERGVLQNGRLPLDGASGDVFVIPESSLGLPES